MAEKKQLNTEPAQNSGLERLFKVLSIIVVLISFGIGLWAYPNLPDVVPSHWNAAGEVDGYASAFQGAFFIPALLLGLFIMFLLIPKIDPKRANFSKMGRVYWAVAFSAMVFMAVVHAGALGVALGYIQKMPSLIYGGVGILFIILGNYMGKVKHNYMFGIRNPWTLASEEVWYRTHRFAAPLWVVGGVLMFFTGFIPSGWVEYWFFTLIFAVAGIPTIYSLIIFNKLKKHTEE